MRKINNKGITLISLIITTIILLILAGISIATLIGENGLLTKVRDSKLTTEKGELEDKIRIAYNEWQIDMYIEKSININNPSVTRGGSYDYNGNARPVSHRGNTTIYSSNQKAHNGFRVTLI